MPAPHITDFRLVQRDVILVEAGIGDPVRLGNAQSANFATTLVIATGTGAQIPETRRWVSSTHNEAGAGEMASRRPGTSCVARAIRETARPRWGRYH